MVKVSVDDKNWRKEWARITRRALPQAICDTLNVVGEDVMAAQKQNLRSSFTLRNQYTERSLRLNRAKMKADFRKMYVVVGSVSEYLPRQEEGAVIRARKRAIPVPTMAARTGKKKAGMIATRYRMNRLGTMGASGNPYFIATLGGRPGIFVRNKKRLTMIRYLGVSHYVIKPRHWHSEAVKRYATYRHMTATYKAMAKRGRVYDS